ncbi:hypothetical protein C9374_001915 [Naegleria lovaniensis]|uniref:Uncharacterized protein n=1 Tax=Naegleria lovaniensis TaxID=51637 RepID=A0AA88GU09_NAELO|nr:uncharacterized protein C9374_001915 [Naegleria lovaniensis]KAG2386880.1 hypothetical protein C9374_001915 [Naegleria lovaniensis]
MAQLQHLIRQNDEIHAHDEGNNGFSSHHTPPSSFNVPSKPTSGGVGALLSAHAEEQKMSKMKRLSTNLAELFSKKKPSTPTSGSGGHDFNDTTSECHSTVSADQSKKKKQEKRKSLFGKLLTLNKH